VLRAMDGYPAPEPAVAAALETELGHFGVYRFSPDLEALGIKSLLDILATYRWRSDWALWCNAELQESHIVRNQCRAEGGDFGYYDEILACPILVLESVPVYDSSNPFCRRLSGALSARLSVTNKVTLVFSDPSTIPNYPAHRRHLAFQELFEDPA
jgi:hypothetical protein